MLGLLLVGFYVFGFQDRPNNSVKVQTRRRRGHCALIFGVRSVAAVVHYRRVRYSKGGK